MNWTAVVPLKGHETRKIRLAGVLSPAQREQLALAMFENVVGGLERSPCIARTIVLSDTCPPGWSGSFIRDHGRGLNSELQDVAACLGSRPLLVILADLPLVQPGDIAALLAAAQGGCAIAPNRQRDGTNALALRDPAVCTFAFGRDSFQRHTAQMGVTAKVIRRLGLGLDVDTPDDLRLAISLGASWTGHGLLLPQLDRDAGGRK